jgi:hypothetical protein
MSVSELLLGLAILCVVWGIVSSMSIASFLSKRGHRISLLFFRVLVLRYIRQYHEITVREQGRPGPWFYSYIVAMNAALACAVVGILLR